MSTHSIRVGFIGLDTSHAPTFTKILHNPYDPFHIPGARVVAAYPGGSPDMKMSISRVEGFTCELRDKYGVQILDNPVKVAAVSDLVFILASDGRAHPSLFRAVAGSGKPVFIDKPFALSAVDAEEIFTLATVNSVRVFASSAFRYADSLVNTLDAIQMAGERVQTCTVRCWLPFEETQGRYFWYGIHAAEMLVAAMGNGVRSVNAAGTDHEDRIAVSHEDGRESFILGSRSDGAFGIRLETDRRQIDLDLASSMGSLSARVLWAALDVLTNGKFPRLWRATPTGSVAGNRPGRGLDPANEETLQIVRLLEAAQRSYELRRKVLIEPVRSAEEASPRC